MNTSIFNPYEQEYGAEVIFPSSRNLSEAGNRIYNRYPARSIFLVPRSILAHKQGREMNILDPFMGSGTTATEAVLSGNKAWGAEIDTFAKMIADASAWVPSGKDISHIEKIYQEIIKTWENYPPENTPDLKGISRWFKNNDLEMLLRLRKGDSLFAPRSGQKFKYSLYFICYMCLRLKFLRRLCIRHPNLQKMSIVLVK